MRIEIVNVSSREKVNQYYTIEVIYKAEGKPNLNTKKLMSFKFPEVFKVMEGASRGEFYEVTNVKEGQYWNWTEARKASDSPAETPQKKEGGTRVVGSNYETPEEREWNRTRIIRQSCINYAVNLLEKPSSSEAVLETAAIFENWVNRKDLSALVAELPDDIVD